MPQDEVDEIEVYGSEAQSGTQLATYSFEVRLGPGGGAPTLGGLPEPGCVCRSVTASSTLDPVPTLPWASLPSSLKRCRRVETWAAWGAGACPSSQPPCREMGTWAAGACPYFEPLCSFRTAPSQTWRSWCALAMGRTGPCPCYRYVGAGAGWCLPGGPGWTDSPHRHSRRASGPRW